MGKKSKKVKVKIIDNLYHHVCAKQFIIDVIIKDLNLNGPIRKLLRSCQ